MSKSVFCGGLRLVAAGFCLLAITATPVLAQDAGRMDQVVRAAADKDEFSGSVLVARDGQILLDRGYGLANREWSIPNDSATRFRLGSVTKQFTAVAIMLLNERGQVDLDAPVKTYLPNAPAAWDRMTVRHLLTHTAALADYTRLEDFEAKKTLPTTAEALMARFRDRPLAFQPGEGWAYSNSGYVVLTAIIERVSGQTYADFVVQNLFHPLNMGDSGYDSHDVILPRRASGYTPSGEGVINAAYVDMSVPQGAGGLYSTTHDLLKWEQGLFGARLLKPQSLAILTTPYRNNYALGLEVAKDGDDTIISHSGAIDGFNTYLAYDTTNRMTVVVLGNLNGAAPLKLGGELMTLARGGAVTLADERQAAAMSADALAAYSGVYQVAPGFALTLKVADGVLTAQATGQKPVALTPETTDAFFVEAIDAQITFTRNAAGGIEGLVLHQGGREMPAPRQ
ncbi:CubicO group peptidase (beta-lactamase class C family) [Brevundimonas nasdae]|uniref:serine hydrolase n=1 Tax=Brevundimonas nasdae TaxID=172043 RepID=UPI001913EC16|nr:serine hydrolase [Brevundimonas nasdae]MBK6023904.1 serine hydrolase [Brevundimonas nasdae]MDQ0450558.1 CubicO group peptidase (beta-lactamase class C family) [Brevundimonas nasdae]